MHNRNSIMPTAKNLYGMRCEKPTLQDKHANQSRINRNCKDQEDQDGVLMHFPFLFGLICATNQ